MKLFDELTRERKTWWSPKGFLLFVLPLPLIPALIIALGKGEFNKSIILLLCIILFLGGALFARRGMHIENEINAKDIKRKLFPLKSFAATLVSFGTGVCAYFIVQHELLFSMLLAGLSFLAFYMCYGLDKYSSNTNQFMDALIEADEKISSIQNSRLNLQNEDIKTQLGRIVQLAKQILTTLKNHPEDIYKVRKFLYVYLDGAQQVCNTFIKNQSHSKDAHLEEKFHNVLVTIEDVFAKQLKKLSERSSMDLDVQIEVLHKRLKEEGLN